MHRNFVIFVSKAIPLVNINHLIYKLAVLLINSITKTTRVKSIPRVCNIIWLSFLRHNKDLIQLATIERYSDKRNVLLVFFKDLWRLQKSFFTSCVCLSINYKLTKNVMKSIPIIPAFASIIRYYNVFSLYIFWGQAVILITLMHA